MTAQPEPAPQLAPDVVPYLEDLAANNNREWFEAHKPRYQAAYQAFAEWVQQLISAISEFYPLEGLEAKQCLYRVYRDPRFSKGKPPYNPWFSATLGPGGKKTQQPHFYIRIRPSGQSELLGGMGWMPTPGHLAAVRQEIDYNPQPLLAYMQSPVFKERFQWRGEALKRPPKGYAADHPHIELLKQKAFYGYEPLPLDLVKGTGFFDHAVESFRQLMPLVDYLNHALAEV